MKPFFGIFAFSLVNIIWSNRDVKKSRHAVSRTGVFQLANCLVREWVVREWTYHMGVSENRGGPPKSSIFIGFSIINHPFWGTPIFGNTHMAMGMRTILLAWSCDMVQSTANKLQEWSEILW